MQTRIATADEILPAEIASEAQGLFGIPAGAVADNDWEAARDLDSVCSGPFSATAAVTAHPSALSRRLTPCRSSAYSGQVSPWGRTARPSSARHSDSRSFPSLPPRASSRRLPALVPSRGPEYERRRAHCTNAALADADRAGPPRRVLKHILRSIVVADRVARGEDGHRLLCRRQQVTECLLRKPAARAWRASSAARGTPIFQVLQRPAVEDLPPRLPRLRVGDLPDLSRARRSRPRPTASRLSSSRRAETSSSSAGSPSPLPDVGDP